MEHTHSHIYEPDSYDGRSYDEWMDEWDQAAPAPQPLHPSLASTFDWDRLADRLTDSIHIFFSIAILGLSFIGLYHLLAWVWRLLT